MLNHVFELRTKALSLFALFLLLSAGCVSASQPTEFRSWPAGASPTEVGKRVAARFVATVKLSQDAAIYPAVCTWYGALNFAQLTRDTALLSQLVSLYDQQFTPALVSFALAQQHVDFSVSGAIPLQIYTANAQHQYLADGINFAEHQWESPSPDGLSRETRYWIDDMYMITILQVQAYRATGNTKYLDRAAREMTAYLDKLQQPNGLFYHSPDAPFFWGRGNGWVAAGMTELLRSLPPNHPQRARIMAGYRRMMNSLLAFQTEDGMWRQLVDHPEAWPESSSTGMFTFAMITGVKKGWLDKKRYGPSARKGWLALVRHLDANADLTEVCEGTGRKNGLNYYLQRKRNTGDLHGQAPILWCAFAVLRS
ncbi:MAG TPA: glycoside hydrolase family 88 protein [Candidatus Angelobacter sp.]|nr:glycoside hydrolase family 88 protein [Candidatus Angelobacter sp.]